MKTDFYATAKPFVRWWWFSGRVREDDIRYQLDWLRANGFGGVEIEWVYPLPDSEPGPRWLSSEWSALVAFTKSLCDELGLGCDFGFGTLWPFGGSTVPPEDASQTFDGPSAQRLGRSWEMPFNPPGLILNHLDHNALERYASKMGTALRDALAGSKSALFCDSWEVETEKLWTAGFDTRFRDRFGYDLRRFLPALNDDPDVRYDYRKLLAEYVLNEFFAPFTDICRQLGGFSRVQCLGAPTDLLAAYAAIDVPESEAILFDPHFSSFAASAAALKGKTIVSCESFTCLHGWNPYPGPGPLQGEEQVADIKLLADALFANGVNMIVWHGMPYNPPGRHNRFYASVHVGPDSSFAPELPAFNRYLEKVSAVMRQGKACTDVAVYLPLEDNWMRDLLPEDMMRPSAKYWWELQYQRFPEELRGWHPLWVTKHFLSDAEYFDGRLHCGPTEFRWLYLDVEYLDHSALREILRLARQGLPIVLKRRPSEPGHIKHPDYAADLDALCALPNLHSELCTLHSAFGFLPLVDSASSVSSAARHSPPSALPQDYSAFSMSSVVRDSSPSSLVSDSSVPSVFSVVSPIPEFWARIDNNDFIIFFAHPASRALKYPMRYGQSMEAQATSVNFKLNLPSQVRPSNLQPIDLTLEFKPYQSLLFRINRDGQVSFEDLGYTPPPPRLA